jgi:hypothetical protein
VKDERRDILDRLILYTEHAAKVGRLLGIRLAQARGARRG